jgi:2-oxoglutarate ferredoxin oxidoreductase subunit alpha
MNPAALKVNLADLEEGGTLIVNTDGFTPENLKYANYASNPLEDGSLAGYRVHKLPMTTLNMNALKGNVELSRKEIDRCKNFFALGVLYWLYDRPMETRSTGSEPSLEEPGAGKGKRDRAEDRLQLRRHHRSLHDALHDQEGEDRSRQVPEDHRQRSDCDGFVAASQLAGRPLFYGSYPITPASDILHELARHKSFGVKTFQAEDEIAAVCAASARASPGQIGLTGTSGPGVA